MSVDITTLTTIERGILLNKFNRTRLGRRLIAFGMAAVITVTCIPFAGAITQADVDALKNQQAAVSSQISSIENELSALERRENTAIEQITLYQEQIDLLSIQITDTQAMIAEYEVQIALTQDELAVAQEKATSYYQIFCERTRDLEESGAFTYWSILFGAKNFSDLLDRITFVRDVANYDNNMADMLEAARKEVAAYEAQLQEELETQQTLLSQMEYQVDSLEVATERTNALLVEIAANQEAYADKLAALEDDRAALAEDIIDAEEELRIQKAAEAERKRQEEERKRQEAEAAKNNQTNSGTTNSGTTGSGNSSYTPNNTSGSAAGRELANYACTFVGKLKYVWGGTSLTTGADCSGFIQAIYKKWGIYLPRTSWSQAQVGTEVSLSEAQPGDIVFYRSSGSASGGHVGIYIGDGKIVSALGEKWGVKITSISAGKSGLTIRRVF